MMRGVMSMSDVPHYQQRGVECIDLMRDFLTADEFAGYCKGNILKYLFRASHKGNEASDLAKAADYACMLAHDLWLSEVGTNEVR